MIYIGVHVIIYQNNPNYGIYSGTKDILDVSNVDQHFVSSFCFRQYRLIAYRIAMEWALRGETLGPGNRRVLPSCVVELIRKTYPSPNGEYAGFKEANDALQLY